MARPTGPSRWFLDIGAALMVVALVGGTIIYYRQQDARESQIEKVSADLRRLELEIKFQAATGSTQLNGRGWPVTIEPEWFDEGAPMNDLVEIGRPWVEVARPVEANLLHPTIRITVEDDLAGFWYNPYQGIVRARVPVMVSDEHALDLYNSVNGTSLASIFQEYDGGSPLLELMPADLGAAPDVDGAEASSEGVEPDPMSDEAMDPTRPAAPPVAGVDTARDSNRPS